ncbi:mucin-4 isoform X2 [Columba livia]|uniref:mucin-4 isoform X2 n=1 Tax=Columba livia TaxID=8932 RepID=UPI0031BABA6D
MGTRRWTTSTFVGCCIWILHGLRAAGAIPVTTEGSFAAGTVSPIATESEGPPALVMGTAETSTTVANAEIAESILAGSSSSLSFPAGAQTDALVTATIAYGSTALTLINVTKPLNTSQENKGGSAAPTAATSTAAIPEQYPAVTPEAALDVTGAVPTAPLGTTPLFAGVKEDVPAAVTREEAENLDPTVSDVLFPTLPAVTWGAQPAAGSPVGAGVTVLPSQGVTTGTGAVKEDTTRLVGFQTEDSANSWSPSAGRLITNQQDGMLSRAGGIAPEPEGETAPAAEESPSALVPGARGDAVNGEFSTAGSSLLSPESTTVASPGEPSILPSQAALSPAASLAPAGDGDRDGQGAPGLSSEGSTLSPAAIEAPAAPEVTEDMATSLLDPSVPTDAQSDTNPPVLDTVLPTEDVGTMGLTKPSLQPAPWQIPIGEQPPLLASALPPPTDNSSALRAAYPPSGAGASTLPAAGDGAETGTSPDLAAASGTPVSPSLGGSQPWGITAGAPQGANGPGTGSSSASDVPSPASFIPDGLAWPAAGVQGQRAEGPGDIAQAGGPGDDSLYADIQSDTSRSAFSTQQDAANTGELPAGETEALANAKLSPPSAVGDRAGAAPAQGQVPPPGPASLGSAGLQPDLSGAEGPGDLPSEFPSAPGAVYPPLGSAAGPVSGAETPVSPDLSAAQGAPVSPSFEEPQPWGTAAGAPQGAGLPGASGPGTVLTSAWDVPNSAVNGPAGPPSPALRDQFGTNPGLPAVEGQGPGTTEPVLGGAGSGTEFEPSLISAAGGGTVVGVNQLPGAGSLSGPASRSDVVATSSTSEDNRAGLIPAAAPVPDSLSSASPDSETGPGLAQVLGADGTGNAVQAGNPESERPYTETSPSAFSAQQDPSNTGELPAGETGALVNTELSPSLAPGDRAGTGAAPALGQVSPPGPASLGSAGLQPDLSGAEGPEDLPSEFPNAPGAAYPPLGSAAGPVLGAETPVSPDLSAAQGAPVSPSFEEPQPWGAAAGAPQGAGLPGASGPGTVLTSAWDVPNSAVYGPAGSPSPALGDQFGTHPGLPAVEGHGTGTAELMLGGAGSGTEFEPSLISAAGGGTAAGVNQLPGAGSLSGPASHSDAVATSSLLDTASPSALGGAGSTPGALQPSLGAGPGVPPAAGEGAGEAAGDGTSLGQTAAEGQPAGSGAPDREAAAVLQSASTSSTVGSSSPGTAANGANLPGAGEASNGLSTGLEAAGPEEPPVSAPGIQSGADLGLSDARLSQVNVVDLPGGALADRGPSSSASLGEGAGPIIQTTSGVSAPSAFASPQGTQPLLPVAPGAGGVSDGTATSLPASLLLPGHGLTSGLAPNGDPHFVPSTQSGSAPLALGAPGGLAGDAGGAQLWSSEDEVASGMPAPSGEASPRAPTSPNAAPVLPSALEGESSAEGVSAGPGLSARESQVGSSAEGKGELGTAVLGGPALLLPPHQPGSPGDPSGDADGLVPGEANAVLPKVMAGRGDVAQLLPSVTGARAAMETPPRSSLGGTPGLSVLPPAGIAAGSPGSEIPGPGPVSGLSPAGMQPFSGNKVTTSLANGVLAASGSSLHAAFPGQWETPRGFPATARPVVSCSLITTSPVPPAPIPGVRKVLPSPAVATVTSHASSPVFPAPPGGPVTALNLLPSPTVPAIPLYGYGARENDREYVERKVDFNSPLFKPETGFPFGNTLRSSLYFTDNGQIIFPASDNSIFTYPNPPPRGFSGREEVPMIAVFWDNADFSRGVGTTFYQEFPTLNTDKPPFVRDVEAKVRRYLRSSYSAAWTLKITWEKAPAYGARTDTRRTITYQAVLTTDGFRSYVLMLYQAGGMQWDYTRLAATNVLIGYTSGDGFYRNDDLTRRPPAAKYRPDQFRGYNTDLRGLWIYKLESRVGINYRLKCLAWTGQQQEPRMWSQGLPACPCTLQQGQRDPRFKSSRGGWGAARVSMLHSASPNPYGAGVRCLYDSQSRLIEGRQERYWRFFRQASPFRDQELKLYDWCCNQAGSAHLCARYSEKRPKIGCDGYQSPGSSEEEDSNSKEQGDREDK